jgi:hypothetical protein
LLHPDNAFHERRTFGGNHNPKLAVQFAHWLKTEWSALWRTRHTQK